MRPRPPPENQLVGRGFARLGCDLPRSSPPDRVPGGPPGRRVMTARPPALRVTTRNAAFQQWQALLSNRIKRQRAGEFIIQGVRPITLAVEHQWPLHAMVYDMSRPLSRWARDMLAASGARQVAMAPELLAELGEKDGRVPELV